MKYESRLIPGTLQRRYKRFLADVTLASGETVVAHCPNTGSMLGCDAPGSRVWLSPSSNPKRKLAWTWELVETGREGHMACINTARANTLAGELLRERPPVDLAAYDSVRPEVRYGSEKSRIDWLLECATGDLPPVWVEVKNVTLAEDGIGYFPDAVTARGQKHLRELAERVREGDRALLMFCVSHAGASEVRPAGAIDARYAALLREVMEAGVECRAWRCEMTPECLELTEEIPVVI